MAIGQDNIVSVVLDILVFGLDAKPSIKEVEESIEILFRLVNSH